MRSREVVCYSCNHQFRENIIDDESFYVRSNSGIKIEVDDVAQCPSCGKLMYITRKTLIGLETDKYDRIGGFRLS
jgi:hypothetical protein